MKTALAFFIVAATGIVMAWMYLKDDGNAVH